MNVSPTDKLSVELSSAVTDRMATFDCVVDADDLNNVLGIEILAFRDQIGSSPPPALEGETFPRWSYDADSDSLYIRLDKEIRAQKQHKCKGLAFLDKEGVAARVEIVFKGGGGQDMKPPFRALREMDREILDALLAVEFPGRAELQAQVLCLSGREIDPEGSLELSVDGEVPLAPVLQRVPVEGELFDEDGMMISVLLHVVDGTMVELEILRGDSQSLRRKISPGDLRVTAR